MPRPNPKHQTKKPLACLKITKFCRTSSQNSLKTLAQSFRQQKILQPNLKHSDIISKNVSSFNKFGNEKEGNHGGKDKNNIDFGDVTLLILPNDKSNNNNRDEPKLAEKKELSLNLGVIDPYQCPIGKALKYLNRFDLAPEFGPCSNITRSQRFKRARDNALNPPLNVKIIIERFIEEYPLINSNVWNDYTV